jgi:hypothetical protein
MRPVTSFDDLAPGHAVNTIAAGPADATLGTTDARSDSDPSDTVSDPPETGEEADGEAGEEPGSEPVGETVDETDGETVDETQSAIVETDSEIVDGTDDHTDGEHVDAVDSEADEKSVDGVVGSDDGSVDASSTDGDEVVGESVADMTTEVARPVAVANEALTLRAASDSLTTAPNSLAVNGSHSDPAVPQPG